MQLDRITLTASLFLTNDRWTAYVHHPDCPPQAITLEGWPLPRDPALELFHDCIPPWLSHAPHLEALFLD